jgi:hypothetical protein
MESMLGAEPRGQPKGLTMSNDKRETGLRLDLTPLRAALASLTERDPGEFVQAGMIQVVANLGLCPEPQPAALTLPQVREIGGYFQEGLHRCAVLAMVLAGKVAIAPDAKGNLQAIPLVPPAPAAPHPAANENQGNQPGAAVPAVPAAEKEMNDGKGNQPAGQ